MKCQRAQKWLALAADDLPAAVQSHLEKCPECQRFREESLRVVRLVRLKRYERPDLIRVAALRSRIVSAAMSPEKSLAGAAAEPIPAFFSLARVALVGLILVLLGLNLVLPRLGIRRIDQGRTAASSRPVYAEETLQPVPETNRLRQFRNRCIVPVGYRPVSR